MARPVLPPPRRSARALAQLRQWACLDFTGPQRIAPVLRELRALIGFDAGGYFYPGGDGAMQSYQEHPAMDALLPEYFDPRMLRSEYEVVRRSPKHFGALVRHEHGPQVLEQILKVPYAAFLRSDYYNVALRPGGVAHWASLVLRTPQGQGVGLLALYRHTARPFDGQEIALLGRLEATLSRALQPGECGADDTEVCAQAMLVATPMGRLQWLSPQAEALMALAFGWRWRGKGDPLPLELQLLMQRLCWQPQAAEPPALPQWELCNANGWFSLRATRLESAEGDSGAVALHITQRTARGAQLLERLRGWALPRRQHELAYWIARGLPEARIAERMGVSPNTVAYHRRQLYDRLAVPDRQALLDRLGAPTQATTPEG